MTLNELVFRLQILGRVTPTRPGSGGNIDIGIDITRDQADYENDPAAGVHFITISGITDTVNPVLDFSDLSVTANGATVTNDGADGDLADGAAMAPSHITAILIERTDENGGVLSAADSSGSFLFTLPAGVGGCIFAKDRAEGTGIATSDTVTLLNSTSAEATVRIAVAYSVG